MFVVLGARKEAWRSCKDLKRFSCSFLCHLYHPIFSPLFSSLSFLPSLSANTWGAGRSGSLEFTHASSLLLSWHSSRTKARCLGLGIFRTLCDFVFTATCSLASASTGREGVFVLGVPMSLETRFLPFHLFCP